MGGWRTGRVPREWWQHDAFREAVRGWQVEALIRVEADPKPNYEPQPDPARERERMWEEMRRRIFGDLRLGVSPEVQRILKRIGQVSHVKMPDPAHIRDVILRQRGIEPWSFPDG